ncbi:unnamed protein product [Moneuplotes crassus]|uniref:RING-type domain-containing protein n=1 Tax=Euplotes crassus TaxID=5936 RepID=A0AAD1UBD3_EUPCR|nr:unnamed protein product [Moneuplotes crassus]
MFTKFIIANIVQLVVLSILILSCITEAREMQREVDTWEDILARNLEIYIPPPDQECSSHKTCNLCYEDSSCTYIAGACSSDLMNELWDEDYDQEVAAGYCQSAIEQGSIVLEDITGQTIEMKTLDGATSTNNSICEWVLEMNSDKTVNLEIERSSEIYEEILLEYEKLSGEKIEMTNKDLYQCGDGAYVSELTEIKSFKIRVQILNDSSAYTILLSQTGIDYSYPAVFTRNKALVGYISVMLMILFMLLVVSLIVFSFFKDNSCFKNSQQKYHDMLRNTDKRNKVQIDRVMDSMVSGEFRAIRIKFVDKHCAICFEEFRGMHQVHLVNECLHLFHTECLYNWYLTIARTRKLACPQCDTQTLLTQSPPPPHLSITKDLCLITPLSDPTSQLPSPQVSTSRRKFS